MSQEAIRQTQAEFTAFLSALDTVESAGHGGLVALPRERLIEIQRILRAGGGVLQPLPPVPAPGSTSTTTFVPVASVPAPSQSGLTEAELAQIQTRVLQPRPTEELQACAVCLSDMQPGERCTALACGHQYHHDCVLRWLHLSRTCPLCKAHALGAGPPGEHQDKSASPSRNEAEAQLLTAAANAIMASRAASTQHRADLSELTLAAALGEQHQHQHQNQPSLAGSARTPQQPSAVASTISFGESLLRPQPPSAVASTMLLGGRESLLRRIHISAARAGGARAIGGALAAPPNEVRTTRLVVRQMGTQPTRTLAEQAPNTTRTLAGQAPVAMGVVLGVVGHAASGATSGSWSSSSGAQPRAGAR